jgi:hypothetical protein
MNNRMRRSFRLSAWAVLALPIFGMGRSSAQIVCPEMPDKITQVNHDVHSDVKAEVGSLGKLKAGQLGVQTDVVAKNLFNTYPDIDRLVIAEMMAATYCTMIRDDKTLKDTEKRRLWSEFSERVFKFASPSYRRSPTQPPKSNSNVTQETREQSSSPSSQPGNSVGSKPGTEKTVASNCEKSNETQSNNVHRGGATPDLSGCNSSLSNSLVQGLAYNGTRPTFDIGGQNKTLDQNTIVDTDIHDTANGSQYMGNLIGSTDGVVKVMEAGNQKTGADVDKILDAQTANVLKCTSPCGPHGPYPDAALEGLPADLPNARAITGSSHAVADQLSNFIDQGKALAKKFGKDNDVQSLIAGDAKWENEVKRVISSSLDPTLLKAFTSVAYASKQSLDKRAPNGIDICSSIGAKIDLLTMFYNQLLGVGD